VYDLASAVAFSKVVLDAVDGVNSLYVVLPAAGDYKVRVSAGTGAEEWWEEVATSAEATIITLPQANLVLDFGTIDF